MIDMDKAIKVITFTGPLCLIRGFQAKGARSSIQQEMFLRNARLKTINGVLTEGGNRFKQWGCKQYRSKSLTSISKKGEE